MPTRNPIGRCISRIVGRGRNESGMAAVEFSLILPILVLLWIGGVEVTEALSVDRRINNLSSAVGDLVARSKVVTYADVTSIFNLGPKAMYPACDISGKPSCTSQGLAMRVTAVDMNASGTGSVAWSRATGVTAYTSAADNSKMNTLVPVTLRVPNTQVIMSEVYYNYKPAVGYVITGTKALSDRMYFVPRLVTKVQLCDDNNQNCVS
jgi:Flp pilus assembly protein TadG